MSNFKKYDPEISIDDISKLKIDLGINGDDTETLQNVLKVDSTNCKLFYKYFHVSDESIKKKSAKLIELLSSRNKMFHVLHGYSKNGKTTFIRNTIYEYNNKILPENQRKHIDVFSLVGFDFQDLKHGDFLTKIKEILKNTFICNSIEQQRKKNKELECYVSFLNKFEDNLRANRLDAIANSISDSFDEISSGVESYLSESSEFLDKGEIRNVKLKFKEIFDKNVTNDTVANYFIFFVLYEIVKRKELILFEKERYKFVFILDNIDDYLKNNDFEFLKHPQILLSSFFYKLSQIPAVGNIFFSSLASSYKSDRKLIHKIFSFSSQLSFLYVFRTANFLAFAHILKNLIDNEATSAIKHYPTSILDNDYIRFSTIGNTSMIIEKRMARFHELTTLIDELEIPDGYIFLKYMSENFSSAKLDDNIRDKYRNIYNIWNGDKMALWDSIIESWSKKMEIKYFHSEHVIGSISNKLKECKDRNYVLKGVYVHFFLDLLNNKSNFHKVMEQILFSFRDSYTEKKVKNIRRIILNAITNYSEQNKKFHDLNESKPISSVEVSGIGLYNLLEIISNFIKKVSNKDFYEFEEIKSFFKDLCETEKMDHFAQLFSIYKNPIEEELKREKYVNYYNINNEIERFQNEGLKCKDELNRIRLFNNNSSVYLTCSLLSNFEYFSFVSIENSSPLLYQIKRKANIKKATAENEFIFYDTIEKVFKDVKISVDALVDFYVESIQSNWEPKDFVQSKLFSVLMPPKYSEDSNIIEGNFQFKLIIARHFTYIEGFRQIALSNEKDILLLDNNERTIINKYLLSVLNKYCDLFIANYNKITAKMFELQNTYQLDTWQLEEDFEVRKKYKKNIDDILEGKLNEFVKLHSPIENYSKIEIIKDKTTNA